MVKYTNFDLAQPFLNTHLIEDGEMYSGHRKNLDCHSKNPDSHRKNSDCHKKNWTITTKIRTSFQKSGLSLKNLDFLY